MLSSYQFSAVSLLLFVSALFALYMAVFLVKRKHSQGVTYLVFLELAVAVWTTGVLFEYATDQVPLKIFWSQFAYVGITTSPVFYFLFVMAYVRQGTFRNPWIVASLFFIPVITFALAVTNGSHHLIWTQVTVIPKTHLAVYGHGLGFWVFVTYCYLLLFAGCLFLVFNLFRFREVYRSQNITVLMASLLPVIGNIMYVSGLNPVPGLDWTPLVFLLTGGLLAWSMTGFGLFDLVPIARSALVENMGDALLVLDSDCRIVDVNPEMEHLLNCPVKELIGLSGRDLFSDSDICERLNPKNEARFEFVWSYPRGQRTYDVRSTPLADRQGLTKGYLIVMRDMTQRKDLEIERDRLIHELTNANAAKDRLMSIIAHDLRSPINTVFSFVRVLKHRIDGLSSAEILELTNELYKKAGQAFGLIENLLQWALSQTDGLTLSLAPFSVNAMIEEALAQNADLVDGKGVQIETRLTEADVIRADQNMIAVVFRNLLGNAIKYSSPKDRIVIETIRNAATFQIRVSDSGTGMNRETIRRLFKIETTQSTTGTSGEKGSGLGLILCKELVEKHGGRIEVSSQVGEGSTFTVILPTNGS